MAGGVTREEAGGGESGTAVRTFLITDVRGYTRFTLEHGDEAAGRLAEKFAEMTRAAVTGRGGELLELRGDEALAAFLSTRQALWAAIELQDRFATEAMDDPSLPLYTGIGLDAGEAVPVGQGFRGAALNLAARLCSLAAPGEILASETVINLARKVEGLSYEDRGTAQLKGFAQPVRVMAVSHGPQAQRPSPTAHGQTQRVPPIAHGPQPLPIGGFLGALPSGPLVAREVELERVLAEVERVRAGEGRLVLLAGEPGAGKTRLAQEVTLQLRDQGFAIAAGRCYEPQQTVAFYPFADALTMAYEAAPAEIQREAGMRWPYLARLLPEQLSGQTPHLGGESEDQQRLYRAVAGFVQAIAQVGPIALLLDDLHWADSSSLELVEYLARHTRSDRVLLLATYRDVEVGRQHPLERTLVDLERESLIVRVPVRRLPPEGTQELIAASLGQEEVSDAFAGFVHERTEGNPFFVQQVLRVLVERGDVYREEGRWERKGIEEIELPESIRAVVGHRVGRLAVETQAILREASVLGQQFAFDDLLALDERDEDELEQALDEARLAGVIREAGSDGYAFDHALTQQVLYGELSARRRRKLHLLAAETIERLPERRRSKRVAELAWHFLQAQETERALPYTLQAGEQAEQVIAYSDAEMQYRTAIELAEESENRAMQVRTSIALARVLRMMGRYGEALETAERAAALAQTSGDIHGEVTAGIQVARTRHDWDPTAEGIEEVERLLNRVDTGTANASLQRSLADLRVVLAHLLWKTGRYPESAATARQAADEARALGETRILAEATMRRGTALKTMGDPTGVEILEESLPLAEAIGDVDTLTRAYINVGSGYTERGEFTKADHMFRRAVELHRKTGHAGPLCFALQSVGDVLFFTGRWVEARLVLEEAVELARSQPAGWVTPYPWIALGAFAAVEGKWGEAERCLSAAQSSLEQRHDPQATNYLHGTLIRMELLRDRPQEALHNADTWVSQVKAWLADRADADDRPLDGPRELAAQAHLELGDPIRAAELVAPLMTKLVEEEPTWEDEATYRIQARILAAQGQWDEAEATMARARVLCPPGLSPYIGALISFDWGRMLAAHGDTDRARDALGQAVAIFQRLGARPMIERTKQALAAL